MTEDKLQVFLTCERRIDHSQLWKIDTLDPSVGNIIHWTTVKHDEDEGHCAMYMNSRFFCVAFQDYSSSEAKLHIFNFDDLSEHSTKVIGYKITGTCNEFITSTDVVLTITKHLRQIGVVGKFVEFFGPGVDTLSIADRATISNMCPEYGATCAYFPIDDRAIEYLKQSNRSETNINVIDTYLKGN